MIWTVGTVVLVPPLTATLARRYDFDLVPYYPLVITALLLLTSIIIVGGLAAFLVLDEIDAGTLSALRVTPVSLTTFFAYRAATVVVITTVYVVATLSFSGILQPGGLVPALIPIDGGRPLVGGDAAAHRLGGEQQDPGHRDGAPAGHRHRRTALPALVRRLGMEPGFRRASALLGGQGVLGRQRSRHMVAVPGRWRRLQPCRHLAAATALHRQEHRLITPGFAAGHRASTR